MNEPKWMQDPALERIDRAKLEFLQKLVFESQSLSKKEFMAFVIGLAKKGKENSISFSKEEMELIISTIKKYSTAEEIEKINKAMQLGNKNIT